MKKFAALILAALIVLCAFPAVSLAADGTITTGGTYDISTYFNDADGLVDTLTINTTEAVTLTNTGGITATNFKIVCMVSGVNLTLSGVTINDSGNSDTCPLTFTGSGNKLTLATGATNTLKAGSNEPGVCVEDTTALTIDGSGMLNTTGGRLGGAGLGGGKDSSGGSVTITNGNITAQCYSVDQEGGAGIGGGKGGNGGTITISGGTVTAYGSVSSAGIGGGASTGSGDRRDGGTITITGGNVTASSGEGTGKTSGAGIGGGYGGYGGTILISGGMINADSDTGAGIGTGIEGIGGTITISGGNITASSYYYGAGIGGGWSADCGSVAISGGTVTATGGEGAAGIGGGYNGSGGTIDITGGTVTATSNLGYDIGSGKSGATGGTLNLDGAAYLKLTNTGTNASVKIGDCYILDSSTASPLTDGAYIDGALFTGTVIDVTDGSVTGSGAAYSSPTVTVNISSYDYLITGSTTSNRVLVSTGTGAATDIILFGANIKGSGCAFDMSGSKVNLALYGSSTLRSGSNYAGLQCPDGATLTISGDGSLDAKGGSYSAGIGGGRYQSGGNITISGGTILAEAGGDHGAGIGGGAEGGGGNITITGGIVTAKGHFGGAGIGSGIDTSADDVTNITISNGIVTAIGESSSAGIGSGGHNLGEINITITGGTVNASGPDFGAGIGGGIGSTGPKGGGGDITISGGDITATGGETSPGIGNGAFSAAEAVTNIAISGGKVTATSTGSYTYSGSKTSGGAAIGSGYKATGCNIAISGGEVTATAGIGGAGIGGGVSGSGGAIDITGGTVYAAMGPEAIHDIGTGLGGTDGSLSISGTAAVFLAHDSCIAPTTTTHTHVTYTTDTDTSYGCDIPSAWTPTFGSYLRIYTLTYNANGGSGTTPVSMTQLYTTTSAVADGSGLSRTGYTFSGWNTKADGSGANVAAGGTVTFNADATLFAVWTPNSYTIKYDANGGTGTTASSSHTYDAAKALTANGFTRTGYAFAGWATSAGGPVIYSDGQSVKNLAAANGAAVTLYARWTARPVITPSVSGGQIYVGGRITLTPNIPGGAWSFDTSVFSINGSTFTALKSGSAVITYTVEGVAVSYPVTVIAAQLPKTGQDSAWIFVLCGLSAILAAAAVLCMRRNAKR